MRQKHISAAIAGDIISLFTEDLRNFEVIAVSDQILGLASKKLSEYGNQGLRSLNGIQLASCVFLKLEVEIYFTADILLNSFLEQEMAISIS